MDVRNKPVLVLGATGYVGGRLVPLLLFADDIVLLVTEQRWALRRVLEDYAIWRFEVNHGKTQMVVTGSTGID